MITHRNAALTLQMRRRLVRRCQTRPIAHVAAETGVSRACLSKWVNRWRREGDAGLVERSSRPRSSPTRTSPEVVALIECWRRERKWSARLITVELLERGHQVSQATVGRWLVRLGLNRRSWLDTDGTPTRTPAQIIAARPGAMVHMDTKKVGAIREGGGWRAHGRGSAQDIAKHHGPGPGYRFLHSAVDGCTRLAYTESLPTQDTAAVTGFWQRATAWFAAHGITHVETVVTDNAFVYRAAAFTQLLAATNTTHTRIRPYTPRHNGKVERYNRTIAEELLYARPYLSEAERTIAVQAWNTHYNYHRPHTACQDQPPATRTPTRVTNVMRSNN